MKTKLILVPTDFSEPSTHALRFAARLAALGGARVRLLYADYFVPPADFAASAAVEFAISSDEAVDEAKKLLIRYAQQNLPPAVEFETRVVIDSPVAAIVDEARHCGADLVVMGTHGRTGFRRLIAGSVTESVLRGVNIPVITVSPLVADERFAPEFPRIVVPVDYSPECRLALLTAASLADSPDSRIVCVRTVELESLDLAVAEIERMQAFTPREILDRCQYKLLPGDHPTEQIVEFAKLVRADLIAAAEPFARRIFAKSDCPVLVVNEMTLLAAGRAPVAEVAVTN